MDKTTKNIRLLLIINILIIVAFILLISARMALISILLISLYNLIFLKKFKLLFVGFASASFVLILFFSLNDNLQNRFFYKDKKSTFVENFKKWEPRVEIWQCVSVLYRENSISQKAFGYGSFKTTKDELLNCYSESIYDLTKKNWFLKIKYNTHNQFFDFLLSIGFVGLILFLIPILVVVYTNRSNRINISLVIAFLMVCCVENCFHRQLGVYLFGLLIILVSTDLKSTNMNLNING
jgi:O-antigen ligase